MKKQRLNKIFRVLVSSSLFLACSKPQPQPGTQSKQKNDRPSFYQSNLYPIRVDYVPGLEMSIGKGRGNRKSQGYGPYDYDEVEASVNLFEEFKDEFLNDLDFSKDMAWDDVFNIIIFPTKNDFIGYLNDDMKDHPYSADGKGVIFGNILALPIQGGPIGTHYVLVLPGYYVMLSIKGLDLEESCGKECSKAHIDRLINITHQALDGIRWQKPIDQDSKEFLDWKAHTLSLIEETRQSVSKK
ncbi:MAG: hypothetical protein AABZ44_01355 [Elusimicrobiota bacterium]